MKLSHDDYKKIDKLNKRLDAFEKQGLSSYATVQAKDMLEAFYKREGIDTKRMTSVKFKKRTARMTDAQVEEMLQIADMFESSIGSKVVDYYPDYEKIQKVKKSFKRTQELYPEQVTTIQDYIDLIDRINNTDKGVKEYYDSDEIAQIYDHAYSMGLNDRQIENILIEQARNTTLAHDERYTVTINKINETFGKQPEETEHPMEKEKTTGKGTFDESGKRIKKSKRK